MYRSPQFPTHGHELLSCLTPFTFLASRRNAAQILLLDLERHVPRAKPRTEHLNLWGHFESIYNSLMLRRLEFFHTCFEPKPSRPRNADLAFLAPGSNTPTACVGRMAQEFDVDICRAGGAQLGRVLPRRPTRSGTTRVVAMMPGATTSSDGHRGLGVVECRNWVRVEAVSESGWV